MVVPCFEDLKTNSPVVLVVLNKEKKGIELKTPLKEVIAVRNGLT